MTEEYYDDCFGFDFNDRDFDDFNDCDCPTCLGIDLDDEDEEVWGEWFDVPFDEPFDHED